jgi:hypothetical protein
MIAPPKGKALLMSKRAFLAVGSVSALAADDMQLFAVADRDIVSKIMIECCVMAAIKTELTPLEIP